MTLVHFKTLSEESQLRFLFTFGVDIGNRLSGEYQITLFQIGAFYVELISSSETLLCRINPFDDTNLLEPYFDDFDICDLFKESDESES